MWDWVRTEQSLCSFPLCPTESPPVAQGCFSDSELHTTEANDSNVHLLPLQWGRWPLAAVSCIALNKFGRVHSISSLWPQCTGLAAGSVLALSSWWGSGELTSLWPPAFLLHTMERYFHAVHQLFLLLEPCFAASERKLCPNSSLHFGAALAPGRRLLPTGGERSGAGCAGWIAAVQAVQQAHSTRRLHK